MSEFNGAILSLYMPPPELIKNMYVLSPTAESQGLLLVTFNLTHEGKYRTFCTRTDTSVDILKRTIHSPSKARDIYWCHLS